MEATLRQGLTALELPTENVCSFLRYGEMLIETNKVMNLTAITEPQDVATLHFLDCAALAHLFDFRGKKVADVGTGAGFPGVPLKLVEPSIDLTLLDSLNKRIDFLKEVCWTMVQELAILRMLCYARGGKSRLLRKVRKLVRLLKSNLD